VLPEGQQIGHSEPYDEDIFIKVKNWGWFEETDVERNQIWSAEDNRVVIPDFVKIFEQKLVRKPRLDADVRCFFDLSVCELEFDRSV
jgi:hypothetical protein